MATKNGRNCVRIVSDRENFEPIKFSFAEETKELRRAARPLKDSPGFWIPNPSVPGFPYQERHISCKLLKDSFVSVKISVECLSLMLFVVMFLNRFSFETLVCNIKKFSVTYLQCPQVALQC